MWRNKGMTKENDIVFVNRALASVGVSVEASVWDLVNTKEPYPEAIVPLMQCLHVVQDYSVKEGIIRALRVKETKQYAEDLLEWLFDECARTEKKHDGYLWTIGNTVNYLCTKNKKQRSFEAALLKVVEDRTYGIARQQFVMTLWKYPTPEVERVLIGLLGDDEVVLSALSSLKRMKSSAALSVVETLVDHQNQVVRKEALKFCGMKITKTSEQKTGNKGEQIAVEFLEKKGYRFLQGQYHAPGGEIDLVMKDNTDEWVFVEVKMRRSNQYGDAAGAVSKAKLKKMMKAIEHFFLVSQKAVSIPYYHIEVILIDKKGENLMIDHVQDGIFSDDFCF